MGAIERPDDCGVFVQQLISIPYLILFPFFQYSLHFCPTLIVTWFNNRRHSPSTKVPHFVHVTSDQR